MKNGKLLIRIVVTLLFAVALAALYVYWEYNRTHKDTLDLNADYSVTASDLLKEFEWDESATSKKYWDKVVLVDGYVKELTKDDRGVYSVVLGDTGSMSAVRCSMDSIHNKDAGNIKQGNRIAMKGICSGFTSDALLGSDVVLVRCVVQARE